jgi:hypothetical protein
MTQHYEYQSDFARKYYSQDLAEGRAEGEAKAILTVLHARGIPVDDASRRRILNSTNLEHLDRWLTRATHVALASELFA